MNEYRKRIYDCYASRMQEASAVFDQKTASIWGIAYDLFLRGWLPINKDAAILDVGCGGGELLYFFKARGYTHLQGVDISPEQVSISRQVINNVTEANVLDYLGKHPGKYDLITGLDIVEHFHKDEVLRFFDTCYAALRPGGRLILQTPNAESPWGLKVRYGDFTHEQAFDPNSLRQLLSLSGFSDIMSREAGPVIHGVVSLGRYVIWRVIRTGLTIWNLAETGSKGSGIYTRVFLISGKK